jgi:hypothetical protein
MGQYFKAINIDKDEWVYSHTYGSGLKLMEHSYIDNHFVESVCSLLQTGNSWAGDKIVWAGDYADLESKEKWTDINENYPNKDLYSIIGIDKNKVTPNFKDRDIKFKYLINHDTTEYVDLESIKDNDGWKIHPLPLLTCEGNGRGGGDYYGMDYKEMVGNWARNRIEIMKKIPVGYTELIVNFKR